MMNETAALLMPALLAGGPDRMLEQDKANSLMVPLKGYKIHVVEASIRGLSPQAWNTIKEFWIAYFHAAEAEVISYSAEGSVIRENNYEAKRNVVVSAKDTNRVPSRAGQKSKVPKFTKLRIDIAPKLDQNASHPIRTAVI